MTSDDAALTSQPAVQCDVAVTGADDLAQVHGWMHAVLAGQQPAIDPERLRDVLIVVDELASNALLHARGPRRITVTVHDEHVLVEAADSSIKPAAPAAQPLSGPGDGFGLQVVGSVSAEWGQRRRRDRRGHETGKIVWARVATG